MRIALLHKHHDADKLETVKAEMLELGAPTIKAVGDDCYGHWVALEGCHRLRAAHALGLTPEIEEVEYSEEIIVNEQGEEYVISEICDNSYNAAVLEF